MFRVVKKATLMVQDIIRPIVQEKDTVIDGTLGNGNDSLFLGELVPGGEVYSFEVQENAVDKFKGFLAEKNINNINVIHDGHENISKYVKNKISAAIFNLGYLPGGDPNIITKPETTIEALKSCLELLKPGGVISIAVYTGHEGGDRESCLVKDFAGSLNSKEFSVMDIHYTNKAGRAPYIIIIEKNDNYNGGI